MVGTTIHLTARAGRPSLRRPAAAKPQSDASRVDRTDFPQADPTEVPNTRVAVCLCTYLSIDKTGVLHYKRVVGE